MHACLCNSCSHAPRRWSVDLLWLCSAIKERSEILGASFWASTNSAQATSLTSIGRNLSCVSISPSPSWMQFVAILSFIGFHCIGWPPGLAKISPQALSRPAGRKKKKKSSLFGLGVGVISPSWGPWGGMGASWRLLFSVKIPPRSSHGSPGTPRGTYDPPQLQKNFFLFFCGRAVGGISPSWGPWGAMGASWGLLY